MGAVRPVTGHAVEDGRFEGDVAPARPGGSRTRWARGGLLAGAAAALAAASTSVALLGGAGDRDDVRSGAPGVAAADALSGGEQASALRSRSSGGPAGTGAVAAPAAAPAAPEAEAPEAPAAAAPTPTPGPDAATSPPHDPEPGPAPCRNSTDPACGPFRWDPAPPANAPLVASFTSAPTVVHAGQPAVFEVAWSDADATLAADSFSPEGTGLGAGCATVHRTGPWDPPSPRGGGGQVRYEHTFGAPGTYTVAVSLATATLDGDCDDPYRNEAVVETTVVVLDA